MSCCSENDWRTPNLRKCWPSSDPVALNAKQLPHWPYYKCLLRILINTGIISLLYIFIYITYISAVSMFSPTKALLVITDWFQRKTGPFDYLVFDRCHIAFGAPVHSSRQVLQWQWRHERGHRLTLRTSARRVAQQPFVLLPSLYITLHEHVQWVLYMNMKIRILTLLWAFCL